MRLTKITRTKTRQLSRRVLSISLSATLAVNSLLVGAPIFNTADAITDYVHPSTNEINKAKSPQWPHANVISKTADSVTFDFIATRNSFKNCFEYRTDGDISQKVSDTNNNAEITDGKYPHYCLYGETQRHTINASQFVEIRLVWNAEKDERFNWTRFDTLPDPEITNIGGMFKNDAQYKGVYIEVKTANISNAKTIEITITRADGSTVTKESKPAPSGSVSGVNSGKAGAPFIIQQGSYDEAGSGSWYPAPAIWTTETMPTSAKAIITLEDDSTVEETVTLNFDSSSYLSLLPDLGDNNVARFQGDVYRDVATNNCNNLTQCKVERTNELLAGWDVNLYRENLATSNWELVASTTTNTEGKYSLASQQTAGVYHTCIASKAGWTQTAQNWSGSGYLVNTSNLSGNSVEAPFCTSYTFSDQSDKSIVSHFGVVDTKKPTTEFVSADGSGFYQTDGTLNINLKSTDNESGLVKLVANLYSTTGLVKSCVNQSVNPAAATKDFTCTLNLGDLAEGSYYIKANAKDASGKTSNTVTWDFNLDDTASVAPTIATPTARQWFKSTPIVNSWTAATDPSGISHYQVAYHYDDGHRFSNSTCPGIVLGGNEVSGCRDVAGDQTSRNHNPGDWEQGGVTIWVRSFDGAGNASPWSTPVHYYYDREAPVGDITSPLNGELVGTAEEGKLIVKGTVTDNLSMNRVGVQLVKPGVSGDIQYLYDHMVNQNPGVWEVEFDVNTLGLSDGEYGLNLYFVDMAGNVSTKSIKFNIDNTFPSFAITTPANNDVVSNTITIDAVVEDASDITKLLLNVGGQANSWTNGNSSTITRNGNVFSVTVNTNTLPDGPVYVVLRATDGAGNTRYWNNNTNNRQHVFHVDNTSPEVSGVVLNSRSVSNTDVRSENCTVPSKFHLVNGKIDLDAVLADATSGVTNAIYKIRKVSEGGCTQTAIYQSSTAKMVNDGGNNWATLQSSAIDTVADANLVDGNYTIQMTIKDAAGNQVTKYIDITVDNTAPAQPEVLGFYKNFDIGSAIIPCGGFTNNTKVQIDWADNAESDIAGYWFGTKNNTKHMWVGAGSFYNGNMTPGNNPYHYTVIAVDHAGNESLISNPCNITLDQEDPTLNVTSVNEGDVLSNKDAIIIDGNVLDNIDINRVVMFIDGRHVGAYDSRQVEKVFSSITGGDFNFTIPADVLPNGAHKLIVNAFDEAGNNNVVRINFVIDNSNPAVSAVLDDVVINSEDVNNPKVTINAIDTGSGVDYVQYKIMDVNDDTVMGWFTIDNNVATEVPGVLGLADGDYRLRARAYDKAGNKKSGADVNFTVDRNAPALTLASVADSEDTSRTISGTGEPGADIKVEVHSTPQIWISTIALDGTWSHTFSNLEVGDHAVTATSTDAAGNKTTKSTTFKVLATEVDEGEVQGENDNNANKGEGDKNNELADRTQGIIDQLNNARNNAVAGLTGGNSNTPEEDKTPTTDKDKTPVEKGKVAGDSAKNDAFKVVGAANDEGCASLFGICWYWYIPVIIAITGGYYYNSRRKEDAIVNTRIRR